MKAEQHKNIIKKLIREELNRDEHTRLFHSASVVGEMQKQWKDAPDITRRDQVDGQHIWKIIQRETFFKLPAKKIRFYQVYSWIATVTLILGMAGIGAFLMNREEAVPIYVVSAGIQNMEQVSLPDGTIVQLGPGSKLTYPAGFKDKIREVHLDGQAFFDVNKDPSKPFVVQTQSMRVEALGTAFELFAYNIENRSEAILLQGKIKVNLKHHDPSGQTEWILGQNEKIEYNKRDKEVVHSLVNADTYTSWRKRGVLTFENEKLSMIIPRLEQWYGRHIICEKEIADTYKFTFKIRDESLERILYIMSESSPIRYNKSEGGDYTLYLVK